METVIRTVGELSAPDRSAMERVVGHALADNKQITIQIADTYEIPSGLAQNPSPSRDEIMAQFPDWCNVYKGLTDEEIDEIDRHIVRNYSSREFPE